MSNSEEKSASPAADPDACCGQSVKSLLSKDESEVLEFKSWPASHLDAPSKPTRMEEKVARELCGLVNTKGGYLLIGVGDDGRTEGLARAGGRLPRKERDEMLTWVTNVIVDYLGVEHDGRFCREIVEVDGCDILCCAVDASEDGPIVLKKRLDGKHDFFVRAGSTCRPLNSKEMLEYIKTRWPDRGDRSSRTGSHTGGGRPGDRSSHTSDHNGKAKHILRYTHSARRRSVPGMSGTDVGADIDVFLSYSHEAKDSIAAPLARGLKQRGVTVWWDNTAMRISDALHQKIREGIARAHHGVVIISRGYLDSDWGKTELGAMFGMKMPIFPILYGVSAEEAQKKLPAISGTLMRAWDSSPESLMDEIASAVRVDHRGQAGRKGDTVSTPPAPSLPPTGDDGPIDARLPVSWDRLSSYAGVIPMQPFPPTEPTKAGLGPAAAHLLNERNILTKESPHFAQNEHFTRLHSLVPDDREKPTVLFTACPHILTSNAEVTSEEFLEWAKSITKIEVDGQQIGVKKMDHSVDIGRMIFAKINTNIHPVRRALLYREFQSTGFFEYGTSDIFFSINQRGRLEMALCHMIGHFWAYLVHVRLFYKKIDLDSPFTVLLSIGNSLKTFLKNDSASVHNSRSFFRARVPPASEHVTHRTNIQFSYTFGSIDEMTDESIAVVVKKAATHICNAYGETTPNCYSEDGAFSWTQWKHASRQTTEGK